MIEELYRLGNGFVVTPILLAFHRQGVFNHLSSTSMKLELVAREVRANVGPFRIAVRTLRRLGFLREASSDGWLNDPDLLSLGKIPADLTELLKLRVTDALDQQHGRFWGWLESSLNRWGLNSKLLSDALDSFIAVPLLQSLYEKAVSTGSSVPSSAAGLDLTYVSKGNRELLLDWMAARGWIARDAEFSSYTTSGKWLVESAPLNAAVLSYAPLLSKLNDLLFGEAAQAFGTVDGRSESHVERDQNVYGSGRQHGIFFQALVKALLADSKTYAAPSQPLCFVDTGCGDGTLLREIAVSLAGSVGTDLVSRSTFVAADASPVALEAAKRTMAEVPGAKHFMLADLSKPNQLAESLTSLGHHRDQILHVRSFVDHDRLLRSQPSGQIAKWAVTAASEATYLDEFGAALAVPTCPRRIVEVLSLMGRAAWSSWASHV